MPTLGAHIFRSQSSPPRLTTKKAMNQTRTTTPLDKLDLFQTFSVVR